MTKYVVLLSLALTSCSTIPLQRRMALLAEGAVKACKQDSSRCPDAAVCAHAALDASKALQASRSATATGTVDNDAAATLPSLAEGLCVGVAAQPSVKVKP